MTAHLAQIWRHPIKGIGAERLETVKVETARPLPLDRAWAVLQDGGEGGDGWRSCRNFLRGAKAPSLVAVTARTETVTEPLGPGQGLADVTIPGTRITLSHPDRPDIRIDPTRDGAALVDWVRPLWPETQPAPARLVRAPAIGMGDNGYASVSVLNLASLRALGQRLEQELDPRRFRGNLWVEGWAPWEEFDMVGKHLSVGNLVLEVVEPITRCRATEANPETGRRDAATLAALQAGWGHQDFGVYANIAQGGALSVGDAVAVA